MAGPVNILMVGSGSAGSWVIRGHQLGAALGARVTNDPTPDDWAWADVVVLVKRAINAHKYAARATRKPVIWDALDFWSQPAENSVSPDVAVELARSAAAIANPAVIICATQAMATALGGVYLPHHAWPGLMPANPRERCAVVGYQGNAAYLGRWAGWLSDACRVRGWSFQINPDDLRNVDILVSLRDGPWDGWICREWKSGVKLVNAMAAGRPVITQDSAAWRELKPVGSLVETQTDIDAALDRWARPGVRWQASEMSRVYLCDMVAQQYRKILEGVACLA